MLYKGSLVIPDYGSGDVKSEPVGGGDVCPPLCNNVLKWFPWAVVCTPANWRVRVFLSSGIVDRLSENLSVRTIPLSGWMDRRSRYIPFYYQERLSRHSKTCALAASPE